MLGIKKIGRGRAIIDCASNLALYLVGVFPDPPANTAAGMKGNKTEVFGGRQPFMKLSGGQIKLIALCSSQNPRFAAASLADITAQRRIEPFLGDRCQRIVFK